jgi:sigma-B regulation protein RsbU (phosphoserine phosphatase)
MIGILLVLLMAVSAVLYFVIRRQLKPLKQLAESTEELARGTFDVELPVISTHDEIRNLRDSFEQMQHSLANYIEELKETTASKAAMESELKVASDIQRSMLPKIFPPYPDRKDFDVYGELTPAKAVGGDLFDFYIRDEQFFFCIGDVSGKGVPASLVMAVTRTLFRTVSAQESRPDVIVTMLNNAMADGNDSNMFVTLFVGVLDIASGKMTYCNAGHDAPLLVSESAEPAFLPVEANLPVGALPDWQFTLQETLIPADTTIFLYTDGLTEAENKDHAQFGEKRIVEAARTASLMAREFVTTMSEAVRVFVDGADQSDDLTLLAIQYKGQKRE